MQHASAVETAAHLTPLELIDRIAALATPAQSATVQGAPTSTGACAPGAVLIARIYTSPRHVDHPLWDDCDAQVGEGADGEPDWDMAAQPAPDYEVDQSVNW